MTVNDYLTAAQESLAETLLSVVSNPKPNYSLDGQSVSWGEYVKMIKDALKEITELMAYFDTVEFRSSVL